MAHKLKIDRECIMCKKHFIGQHDSKLCSVKCKSDRNIQQTGRYADTSIPTGTIGAISELEVSCDLMKKGYAVFRALSPACFCDLIAIKNATTLKLEVRTGYMRLDGKGMFFVVTKGDLSFDKIFAVYERRLNKVFYFDQKKIALNIE